MDEQINIRYNQSLSSKQSALNTISLMIFSHIRVRIPHKVIFSHIRILLYVFDLCQNLVGRVGPMRGEDPMVVGSFNLKTSPYLLQVCI